MAELGHLDPNGAGGYPATDSMNGVLFEVDSSGEHRALPTLEPISGSADIDFVPALGVVLVALLWEGSLAAIELTWHSQARIIMRL